MTTERWAGKAKPNSALWFVEKYSTDVSMGKGNRDAAILWARESGATFRQIADACGLTPQGCRKIVQKALDNSVAEDVN